MFSSPGIDMSSDGFRNGYSNKYIVNDGQTRKESVEHGDHFFGAKNWDGGKVSNEADGSDNDLEDAFHPPSK